MKILYRYPAYKGKMYKICKIKEASGSVYFAADAAGKKVLAVRGERPGTDKTERCGQILSEKFVEKGLTYHRFAVIMKL